jgi:hypothetical protein
MPAATDQQEGIARLEERVRAELKRLEARIDAVNRLANLNKLEAEAVTGDGTIKLAQVTGRIDAKLQDMESRIKEALKPWHRKFYDAIRRRLRR